MPPPSQRPVKPSCTRPRWRAESVATITQGPRGFRTNEEALKWRAAMHEVMKPATVLRHQLPIMSEMFMARMRALTRDSRAGRPVLLYHEVRHELPASVSPSA